MGKYLKLFNNKNDYNEFIESSDYVLPNVSYIMELGDVKFNPDTEPVVPSDICVTMTFNATEDNLLAFNQVPYNVTSITVDDQPFNFTPIETQKVVKYVTKENAYLYSEIATPTNTAGFYIETINNSDTFTDETILSFTIPGLGYGAEITLSDAAEDAITAYDNHKITITLGQVGMIDNYVFNVLSPNRTIIETKQTSIVQIGEGGLEEPLMFNTTGSHSVKLYMNTDVLSPLSGLSKSTLIECEIENISVILEECFKGCATLQNIVLCDTLIRIGSYAFYECTSLERINIPDSVKSIGVNAFYSCYSLSSVTLGNGLVSIEGGPFTGCRNLPVIDGIRYADTYLVEAVDKTMEEYVIKEGTKWIGDNAFDEITGFTTVTIPNTVISIAEYAFEYCNNLTSVEIPDSVQTIGDNAFYHCAGLTSVTFGNGLKSIGNAAFCLCTQIISIEIPDSVEIIGDSAFLSCDSLTDVTIGSGVITIGDSAFDSSNLPVINGIRYADTYLVEAVDKTMEEYVIKEGTKWFNYHSFDSCTSLTGITIPKSVISVGEYSFINCPSLVYMDVDAENTVYDARDNSNCIIETKTNTLIAGCKNTNIPDTVISIGTGAFAECTSLNSIVIPDSVNSINVFAFTGCTNLSSITLGNSLREIGMYAFNNCRSLSSINIPATVNNIGAYAFGDCDSLNMIISYATSAPSINRYSFYGIAKNGILYIPNGATGYDSWMSTAYYYLGYYDWTSEVAYTPLECLSLTITAGDVSGRQTATTIYYTAVTNGVDLNGNSLTNITVTGTAISAEFPQNTSETETVERTITFEYMGVTASTIITQGIWEAAAYTVNLNNQWQLSTSISNPDSNTYEGVYESYSNKGVDYSAAIMYIDIVGFENFKFYVRSYAESSYDYVVVSNLDCTLTSATTSGSNVKLTTSGKQNGGTAINNYQLVEFTNIDGGEHRISVMYRKDSSTSSYDDRGYLIIPKNQ